MKFNSQICTTEEQSKRLLALGLKKETADMCWNKLTLHGTPVTYPSQDVWSNHSIISDSHFPAWSLHRLINIYSKNSIVPMVKLDEIDFAWLVDKIAFRIKEHDIYKEYLEE